MIDADRACGYSSLSIIKGLALSWPCPWSRSDFKEADMYGMYMYMYMLYMYTGDI